MKIGKDGVLDLMQVAYVIKPKQDGSGEMEYGVRQIQSKPYRLAYKMYPTILKKKSEKKAMELFDDIIDEMQARGYKACTMKKTSEKVVELIADQYEQSSTAPVPKPELKLLFKTVKTARKIFKTKKVLAGHRSKNPFF